MITNFELYGFIVSLVIALVWAIYDYYKIPKAKNGKKNSESVKQVIKYGLLLAGVGILLSISLSIRYEFLEVIHVTRNEKALNIVKDYQCISNIIDENNNPFVTNLCKDRQDVFYRTVKEASAQKFDVSNEELAVNAKYLFKEQNSTSINATSYVKPSEWWKTDWGKEYLEENYKAIKRGCTITRIYIFANEIEMQENIELLNQQKKNGITIYYTFSNKITDLRIKDDIIVIGDRLTGTLILNERIMLNSSFSTLPDDIKINQQKFNNLRNKSEKF